MKSNRKRYLWRMSMQHRQISYGFLLTKPLGKSLMTYITMSLNENYNIFLSMLSDTIISAFVYLKRHRGLRLNIMTLRYYVINHKGHSSGTRVPDSITESLVEVGLEKWNVMTNRHTEYKPHHNKTIYFMNAVRHNTWYWNLWPHFTNSSSVWVKHSTHLAVINADDHRGLPSLSDMLDILFYLSLSIVIVVLLDVSVGLPDKDLIVWANQE